MIPPYRSPEDLRADALQRDRAYLANPALDPHMAEIHPALLYRIAVARNRPAPKPTSRRWYHHVELPGQKPPVLFDAPPLPDTWSFRWPTEPLSWDDPAPCDPLSSIRAALGYEVSLLAAHRLAGWPGITIVLISRQGDCGTPFV